MDYVVRPAPSEWSPEEVEVVEISSGGRVVARGYLATDFVEGAAPGSAVECSVRFVGTVLER